jgi:hypothetical protein
VGLNRCVLHILSRFFDGTNNNNKNNNEDNNDLTLQFAGGPGTLDLTHSCLRGVHTTHLQYDSIPFVFPFIL